MGWLMAWWIDSRGEWWTVDEYLIWWWVKLEIDDGVMNVGWWWDSKTLQDESESGLAVGSLDLGTFYSQLYSRSFNIAMHNCQIIGDLPE